MTTVMARQCWSTVPSMSKAAAPLAPALARLLSMAPALTPLPPDASAKRLAWSPGPLAMRSPSAAA